MTSATSITARAGKLVIDDTLIARLTKWDVTSTLATKNEWGDSDGGGYTNRSAGRKDGTSECEGKYDTASEIWDIVAPEDIVEEVLWINATTLYWAFPRALCSDFKLSINVSDEEVVGYSASFGADGIFYYPGQSGAPSHSLP